MVAFTHLAIALSAVIGSFAAPAADPNADAPDFEFSSPRKDLMARQDYNQNYKTSGNVNFSPTNNGYSVQFSGAGDFVVGKGWRTGTSRYVEHNRFQVLHADIEREKSTSLVPPPPALGLFLSPSTAGRPTL
jgi:hypothetical protein